MNRSPLIAFAIVAGSATTAAAENTPIDGARIARIDVSSTSGATLAGKTIFRPENLLDGRDWSPWGSAPKDRKGAWLQVDFHHVEYISQIEFVPGSARDKSTYNSCGRPAKLLIESDSGRQRVSLKDRRYRQVIDLDQSLRGKRLRIVFEGLFGRSNHGGVCISELKLRGPKDPLASVPGLEPAIRAAVADLADDARAERAITILRRIGRPAALQIRGALDARNPGLTARAAKLLGEIGDRRARRSLEILSRNSDRHVRGAALWALGALQVTAEFDTIRRWFDVSRGADKDLAFDALARIGDERALDLVVGQLVDGNAARRASAAEHLGLYGAPAVAALEPLLSSRIGRERAAAVRALGSVNHPDAEVLLQNAMLAAESEIRAAAIYGFAARSGASARHLIRGRWQSRYLEERLAVTQVLGQFGNPSDIEILELLVSDSSMSVREAAAHSLSQMGSPADAIVRNLALQGPDGATAHEAARGYLSSGSQERAITLLGSRHKEVREAAGRALAAAGTAGHKALLDGLFGDDARVRTTAGEQLSKVGSRVLPELLRRAADADAAAQPEVLRLVARFHDPIAEAYALDRLTHSKDLTIRRAAAVALGACGRVRSATPMLVKALKDPSLEVRIAVIKALGMLKASAAGPALVAFINDANRGVQRAAIRSLGQIKAQNVVKVLSERYKGAMADAAIREEIVLAAAKIGGRASLPLLVTAVGDNNARVRRAAERALQ